MTNQNICAHHGVTIVGFKVLYEIWIQVRVRKPILEAKFKLSLMNDQNLQCPHLEGPKVGILLSILGQGSNCR
jgi:hypothetical protein